MFWSKIYFFLITAVAAAAITIALMLPAPAQRQRLAEERQRVVTACDVANILMHANARSRIELAGDFARSEIDLSAVLSPATNASEITGELHQAARTAGTQLIDSTSGDKPAFVILVDGRGRTVARVGVHTDQYGDMLAGYYLVDDALDGYMRDDLWVLDGKLYLIAAAPVVNNRYVGAVVIGHELDKGFIDKLVSQLGVDITMYAANQPVATSNPVPVHDDAVKQYARIGGAETPVVEDCRNSEPITVETGGKTYTALVARLPGEASTQGAFFTVFVERPDALGLFGTLGAVTGADLSFGNFPWIWLGLGLLVALAGGIALMIFEVDRPLRRLVTNTVQLAQGAVVRLDEERHRSHFGAIARSVNLCIEKLQRELRNAAQGPSAGGGGGGGGGFGGPTPLPPLGSGAPPLSPDLLRPAPAEFNFPGSKPDSKPLGPPPKPPVPRASTAKPTPPPVAKPGTGPGPGTGPLRRTRLDSAITAIDDVLGSTLSGAIENVAIDDSHRGLYQEFLALKQQCGESIANLTYEKFAAKLRTNRDALMAKHGCDEVVFQVYVKDGKAALKAKPVLPE